MATETPSQTGPQPGAAFIVIVGSAYCSPGGPCGISYSSDLRQFATRDAAIAHGFTLGRSDDFNIGVVVGGELSEFSWMNERLNEPPETLRAIAAEIMLPAAAPA